MNLKPAVDVPPTLMADFPFLFKMKVQFTDFECILALCLFYFEANTV